MTCHGRLFEGVRLRYPPEVIAGGVLKKRQRQLCALTGFDICTHSSDQGFECVEVSGNGRTTKTIVEDLLTQRAFRSIERLENGVEIQILPGPFIQELTRPSIFDA